MTPENQAERIIAKYPDSLTIPQKDWWHENITAHIRSAIRAAEIEALGWAQDTAAMFSINKHLRLDGLPWDKMSESSQMVAHTTCQHVAAEIHDEIERRKTL